MTLSTKTARRALVAGLGMIGGSIALALRQQGWHVTGYDNDKFSLKEALNREFVDSIDLEDGYDIAFVATPVPTIVGLVNMLLPKAEIVSDTGSVKNSIVREINDPRFVGGHPMAGSERSGLDGANPSLFNNITWVLTPSSNTDARTYDGARRIIGDFGADVVTIDPVQHDEIVASVSHVPHLAASALMSVAVERATEHQTLMRLAAGGFRDMTRIAAGHPGLWTGITLENRDAVINELGRVIGSLEHLREMISNDETEQLEKFLAVAADARRELPPRAGRPIDLAVLRVTVADKPGGLGLIFGTLSDMSINIEDFEILHNPSTPHGLLNISVAETDVLNAAHALRNAGLDVVVEML